MAIPESVSTNESVTGAVRGMVDIGEATRQLRLASHDAQVAFDCINLGDLDRAHIHAITARAAADAAENIIRVALGGEQPASGF